MRWVIVGSALIVAMLWILLTFTPCKARKRRWQNLFAGIFVTVSAFSLSRGGAHQRPARQFFQSHQRHEHCHANGYLRDLFVAGWTAPNLSSLGPDDGGVVCIAAAIAGATSQISDWLPGRRKLRSGNKWDSSLASRFRPAIGTR